MTSAITNYLLVLLILLLLLLLWFGRWETPDCLGSIFIEMCYNKYRLVDAKILFMSVLLHSYSKACLHMPGSLQEHYFKDTHSGSSSPVLRLPESGKPSALDFTQSAATADECDGSGHCDGREDLEESPRTIVQEEDALDGEEGAKEHNVRDRSRLQGGRQVVDVDAEEEPLEQCQRRIEKKV